MVVLGIDPGTTRPGFGVIRFEGSSFQTLDFGLAQKEAYLKSLSQNEKLLALYNAYHLLIEKYNPSLIGVEGLFFSKNVKTAFSVLEARAILLLCATQKNIPLYEPTPIQVKKGVTGNGKASKVQIAYMVQKILNLPKAPKPDDVTDALAVAIASAFSYSLLNKFS
jgi:crossover junction endodeoxyribonuclease RuvC